MKNKIAKNTIITIEKIVLGGFGLGRLPDGRIIFVANSCPGEEVKVNFVQQKKGVLYGTIKEIITASPERQEARCPHYNNCGGCHFQHLPDSYEKKIKLAAFKEQFLRAKLVYPLDAINFKSSPNSFGYRQRVRLQISDGDFAFFGKESLELITVDQCLLAQPEINQLLTDLQSLADWDEVSEWLKDIEVLFNESTASCHLIATFLRKPRPGDLKKVRKFQSLAGLSKIILKNEDGAVLAEMPAEKQVLSYSLPGPASEMLFALEAGSFCQVNLAQNRTMVASLLAIFANDESLDILDLYCGIGNFSLPLAQQGHHLTGVDIGRAAIRMAKKNSKTNNLAGVFLRESTDDAVDRFISEKKQFSAVVIDPPRTGIKNSARKLVKLGAKKIVYVSCDPATLFRDLQEICRDYKIVSLNIIDMFPQTAHVETMVVLEASI